MIHSAPPRFGHIMVWILLGLIGGLALGGGAFYYLTVVRNRPRPVDEVKAPQAKGVVLALNTGASRIWFENAESKLRESFLMNEKTRFVNFPGDVSTHEGRIRALMIGQKVHVFFADDIETAQEVRLLGE